MTQHPETIDARFVQELRAHDLGDEAIREAANVGFHYNLINRIADAFDFPLPSPEGKEKLAKMLDLAGRLLEGSQADEVWTTGSDGRVRPTEVEAGRDRMLTVDGETSTELRTAVEAFVVRQWIESFRPALPLPVDLEPYLTKLARAAYKITDEELESLQASGYSKDAIYEITLAGSFGAALVGLEALFAAMVPRLGAGPSPV